MSQKCGPEGGNGLRIRCSPRYDCRCLLLLTVGEQFGGEPSGPQLVRPRTTGTASSSQIAQGEIDFARCLRSHGVNEPDPKHVPGHSGLVVDVPTGGPGTSAAVSACNHLLPATSSGLQTKRNVDLPALTRYAQCMRAHDIAMLDPNPETGSPNLGSVPGISSDFGRYSPQFRSADEACRHLLPAGVHDDGTGP